MRISDWSSDVCSSDLVRRRGARSLARAGPAGRLSRDGPVALFVRRRPRIPAYSKVGARAVVQPHSPSPGDQLAFVVRQPQARKARCSSALARLDAAVTGRRSEEHTSELQSLMRISYAVFCLK